MRLFLPDGKTLNLEAATKEQIDKLSKTKGYEHLFESPKKETKK